VAFKSAILSELHLSSSQYLMQLLMWYTKIGHGTSVSHPVCIWPHDLTTYLYYIVYFVYTNIFLSILCRIISVYTLYLHNLLGLKLRYYVTRIGQSYKLIGVAYIIKSVHLIETYSFYVNLDYMLLVKPFLKLTHNHLVLS
jgi:hypothetical protein